MQSIAGSSSHDTHDLNNIYVVVERIKVVEELANAKAQSLQLAEGDSLDAAFKFMQENIALTESLERD